MKDVSGTAIATAAAPPAPSQGAVIGNQIAKDRDSDRRRDSRRREVIVECRPR